MKMAQVLESVTTSETLFGYTVLAAGLAVCPLASRSLHLRLRLTREGCISLVDYPDFAATSISRPIVSKVLIALDCPPMPPDAEIGGSDGAAQEIWQ